MWLFTKYGFYSVVQTSDPKTVMVRARNKRHLNNLKQTFDQILADYEIKTSLQADYMYRMILPQNVWQKVSAELSKVNYSNFKDKCDDNVREGKLDGDYLDTLHQVWQEMYEYQSKFYIQEINI